MALLNLLARLGLDNSEFHKKLGETEQRANIFAKRLEHSFKHEVTRFATAGFAIEQLKDAIENAEKLRDQPITLVDEKAAQRLIDVRTGLSTLWDLFKSFVGWTASVNPFLAPFGFLGAGVRKYLGEDRIKEMDETLQKHKEARKLRDEMQKQEKELGDLIEANNRKQLSDEDRKVELLRRQKALMDLLIKSPHIPRDKAFEMMREVEKLRGEALGIDIKPPQLDKITVGTLGGGSLDPLARIGGFTGRVDVRILTYLERTAAATEETAGNTRNDFRL